MKFQKSLAQKHVSSSCRVAHDRTPAHGKTQLRNGARSASAKAKVATQRAAQLTEVQPGFLRRARLRRAATRNAFADSWEQFLDFCLDSNRLPSRRVKFASMTQLDAALESFAEQQFLDGSSRYVVTCALQNVNMENPRWPTSSRANFPLTKSAKKGWNNLEPQTSRDPCPMEVAWWVANDLASRGLFHYAAGVVIAFDTYLRPGKLCELRQM